MKLKITTSIAALLIATSAYATSYDASRGADNETAAEVFTSDADGFMFRGDGTAFVDIEGNPVQIDLTRRAAGADDTALMGVDDEGDITASRGADNPSAVDVMVDADGYLMDTQGRYYVNPEGLTIQVDFEALSERSAGADPTATMGVDDTKPITASRGADNQTAAEAATD